MKDMLKLVDQDYAALVHNSCTDPNSMLHPTTKHFTSSQYIKAPLQVIEHQLLFKHQPRKTARAAGTLARSDKGQRDDPGAGCNDACCSREPTST